VPDKLGVYNGALSTYLDTRPLKTLSDSRAERRALDGAYDETLKWMLEQAMWNFATKAEQWMSSDTATPEFGYRFFFEKPDDYVRLVKISADERFGATLSDFSEEGDFFAADADPIYVMFVSDAIDAGSDPGKWGTAFAAAFEAELAWRARGGVKPLAVAEVEALQKIKRRLMNDAKTKDVVNQPFTELAPGRLVRSRFGGAGYNKMRRTPYQ
jgi:hypothetical protein